ncbi:NAD(P)/FAD-dependent oxidoreductase [Rufibacter tibetensis]|uniref:Pyridine nucleotide-disulfide oxidoreductase n=1 Tax=Rufibacter tibetensis TaxID=512763 RepID=A0A0P0CXH5_9BACT|nr:NAD(P)/FAD-dependent oxidoreductase [Rufibacter tibetensis]ALI99346.1 pyridine nucleotide-disulfide oxidoreductase [Rufibacter tibetensis]
MEERTDVDVIIIGGSYAGLSAAMALGRSLRKVLILDTGPPCNRQTPHSHNFLTQDGETPAAIAQKAREQVLAYPTVTFKAEEAVKATRQDNDFQVATASGATYRARKLIFATGIKDLMPDLKGFAECWGISVLHCPYCHGYEVHNQQWGILANGDMGFELVKLLYHWSPKLTLFTNGKPTFTPEQLEVLQKKQVAVEEKELAELLHDQGYVRQVVFTDGSTREVNAIFARPAFVQHCSIPQELGCQLTETGHLQADAFQRTTVPGVLAAGDATTMMRTVALAVAAGSMAGVMVNKELMEEDF